MTKNIILAALLIGGLTGAARADEGANIESLDQRVKVLERQLEIQKEDADAKKPTAVTLNTTPSGGFAFYNPDKTWGLKLSGVLQADTRNYLEDQAFPQTNSLLPRRARLQIDANLGPKARLRIQHDFVGGLVDAYGELKLASFATARVGLFKTPLSLERWRSDPARDWVELGYVAGLVTDRDTGAWLELADADQAILFGAGVFNGSTDTGSVITADTNDDKDAVAKLFIHPFRFTDGVLLRDLGFGVAGSVGEHVGSALPSYKSIGQATIYSLSGTAKVSALGIGSGYRIVPQAYFYFESLSFLGEYIRSGQSYSFKAQDFFISQEAYDLQLGWVITGEDAAFKV